MLEAVLVILILALITVASIFYGDTITRLIIATLGLGLAHETLYIFKQERKTRENRKANP